jgi:hypothetical protein
MNPNGKQLVVYQVTTLLFPGKQPIACLTRETTLSKISKKIQNFHKISKFQNIFNITKNCQMLLNTHFA